MTHKETIQLIEYLTSSDDVQDLEFKKLSKSEKFLLNTIDKIYRISHSALGDCGSKHQDWVEESELILKKYETMQM